MKLVNNPAGCKRTVLIASARVSLRIADRLLRAAFKAFRSGYLPLGTLRAASSTAGRLRRLSLNLWAKSRPRPPVEDKKPLPECLMRMLQQQGVDRTKRPKPGGRIPIRNDMRMRWF